MFRFLASCRAEADRESCQETMAKARRRYGRIRSQHAKDQSLGHFSKASLLRRYLARPFRPKWWSIGTDRPGIRRTAWVGGSEFIM